MADQTSVPTGASSCFVPENITTNWRFPPDGSEIRACQFAPNLRHHRASEPERGANLELLLANWLEFGEQDDASTRAALHNRAVMERKPT
jgi:hypothetical protein